LRAIETLTRAGIPVHVNVAPVIPFINEPEIERILEAAARAGAVKSHYTVLRLPWEVSPLFEQWLAAHFPDRAQRVLNRVRDVPTCAPTCSSLHTPPDRNWDCSSAEVEAYCARPSVRS
jgi:DNA repair photolyase